MPTMDFNDAEEQRQGGTIPDGTFVKAAIHIRPGGASLAGMDPTDTGLFKNSDKSDAVMIDCEFTVLVGPYAHRKWWENMVVAGGTLDEKGVSKGWNMTKSRIRAMLESAMSIDPKDMSEPAKQKRQIPYFKYIDGMPFYVKLTVEEGGAKPGGGTYAPKNVIDRIVIPGDAEYADLAAGKEVAPMPRNASVKAPNASQGGVASNAVPAWQTQSPPAGAASAVAQPSLPGVQAPTSGAANPASPSSAPAGPAWLRG